MARIHQSCALRPENTLTWCNIDTHGLINSGHRFSRSQIDRDVEADIMKRKASNSEMGRKYNVFLKGGSDSAVTCDQMFCRTDFLMFSF